MKRWYNNIRQSTPNLNTCKQDHRPVSLCLSHWDGYDVFHGDKCIYMAS